MASRAPPVSEDSPRARVPPRRAAREAEERRAAEVAAAAWRRISDRSMLLAAAVWMLSTAIRSTHAVISAKASGRWEESKALDWEAATLEILIGCSLVGFVAVIGVGRLPRLEFMLVGCATLIAGCYGHAMREVQSPPQHCPEALASGVRMMVFAPAFGMCVSALYFVLQKEDRFAFMATAAGGAVQWFIGLSVPLGIAGAAPPHCLSPASWNQGLYVEWESVAPLVFITAVAACVVGVCFAGLSSVAFLAFKLPERVAVYGAATAASGVLIANLCRAAAVAQAASRTSIDDDVTTVHSLGTHGWILWRVECIVLSCVLAVALFAQAAQKHRAPPPSDLVAVVAQAVPNAAGNRYAPVTEDGEAQGARCVQQATPPPRDVEMVQVQQP
eukprot:TRINITY_DN11250_c0_g1_i1.p1 TRINITY_DN11250_c0_g1~~TRINITY_DN11250_c0_g1_i1.p1  ORF type:complete len:413 (+),score=119.61 TRINITY_DN11250_c0_g1_i1:77-1240(+)